MTPGVTSNDASPQTTHGPARYRVDGHGTHVVIVPTHCPSRRHSLATTGCRIIETSDTLTVTCHQCTDAAHPEHSWILATGGRQAQSAEFGDAPYAGLLGTATP